MIADPKPGFWVFLISLVAFAGVVEFIAFSVGGFSVKKRPMSAMAVIFLFRNLSQHLCQSANRKHVQDCSNHIDFLSSLLSLHGYK